MLRSNRPFVSATAVLLGAGIFITIPQSESQGNNHSRPFKAVGTAVWDDISAAFAPNVGANFEGSGVGTHLGKFVQVGDLFFDGPPDTVIPGHGSVTLIAANGDELNFDYTGELDSTTGGTGRFANASGDGGFYAEIDLSGGTVDAPMTVWLWGDLAY